ncbi:hypothetical protein CJH86_05450 [Salmonella enterica]|nr:hypothetical protein [Salmonella enterica]EIL8050638.1 hypothetical protein [Salmonella enterica]ELM4095999.1 hypothetical protein [Salmonella enterica]
MSNDMYFDPTQFDFTNLVDVVETSPEKVERPSTRSNEVGPDGGVTDDVSDLKEFSVFDETDEDQEETEQDANNDISDLLDKDNEEADAIKIINDLDDNTPLDIDGFTATKAELRELAKRAKTVDEQSEFLNLAATTFDQGNQWIELQLLTKTTAVDKNINYLENCLNHPQITSDDYRNYHDQLKAARKMKEEIENDAKHIAGVRREQEQALTRNRWTQTDVTMQQVYPDWIKWRDTLINDALARGISAAKIEKDYDPQYAQMMLESFQYRKNKAVASEKAKAAAQAKAARSVSSKTTTAQLAESDKKAAQLRALKQKQARHGLDRDDMAKLFEHLKD